MEELILIFLERVLEAIYFSMFLLIGKNIKEKRILFIGIMIFEYLMLKYFIKYSIYFQLIYTFMSYVNLKVLYKDKAQITDIFLFAAASLILMIICGVSFFTIQGWKNFTNYFIALILSRILMFSFIVIFSNKIHEIYKNVCSIWNRHNYKNKMKSLTVRNISIILFNIMFYIINLAMGLYLIVGGR